MKPRIAPRGLKAVTCVQETQNSLLSIAPGLSLVQRLVPSLLCSGSVVVAPRSFSFAPAATAATSTAASPVDVLRADAKRPPHASDIAKAPKALPIIVMLNETAAPAKRPAWPITVPRKAHPTA